MANPSSCPASKAILLTREALAARAGVDGPMVDRLIEMGTTQLKGFSGPVSVFEATGAG